MAAESTRKPPEKVADTSEPPKTLMAAIHAVQAEMSNLPKSASNPHFKSKYVPLDKLMEAMMPLLNKNGLVWLTLPCCLTDGEEKPGLEYRLQHVESKEGLMGVMALLAAKDDPQGQGSAITYARRQSIMAVFGVAGESDDDGNAATESRRKQQDARQAPARLTAEQIEAMRAAILDSGRHLDDVCREVGIKDLLRTTVEEGRKVRALLAGTREG